MKITGKPTGTTNLIDQVRQSNPEPTIYDLWQMLDQGSTRRSLADEFESTPPANVANVLPAQWQWRYAKPGIESYITQLNPIEEAAFQSWVQANKIPWQDIPTADYDMRGYWKEKQANPAAVMSGINPNDMQLHFTDKYKTPYHKSFSRESMYALPTAPKWINDYQLADESGKIMYDEQAGDKK
jgi:hypothetical protein